MNPSLFFDILVTGLITGGIYALVALGLNLQYGLMRVLNVAHGEFLMLGATRCTRAGARTRSSRCSSRGPPHSPPAS